MAVMNLYPLSLYCTRTIYTVLPRNVSCDRGIQVNLTVLVMLLYCSVATTRTVGRICVDILRRKSSLKDYSYAVLEYSTWLGTLAGRVYCIPVRVPVLESTVQVESIPVMRIR